MNVINIENVSKSYIIKHNVVKQDTLRDSMTNFAKEIFKGKKSSEKEEFWALKNINLKIEKGERLGLIGANGAGKSTLLKVLSRITSPTTGELRIKGRMASLLEVGTGFHPELTGRENIFLNGAILGMRKAEIKLQFNNIVEFAGIEKFLDTPVKRYSSGMYVRLGFAIAAHLEPEILVVDEVLAVGDADFQKKSIGKMRDVSKSGRTIIFVSHNLTAVQSLCNTGALLKKGELVESGPINSVVNNYIQEISTNNLKREWLSKNIAPGNEGVFAKYLCIEATSGLYNNQIITSTSLKLTFDFWNELDQVKLNISVFLYTITGECIFNIANTGILFSKGVIRNEFEIPGDLLNDGSYFISIMVVRDDAKPIFFLEEALTFDIHDFREGTEWLGKWPGAVRPVNLKIVSSQLELE